MHITRLLPFVLTALLAACATTEEQKPVTAAPQSSAASGPVPATSSVGRAPVAGMPTKPGPTAPRKMAAPGKNSVYFDYDRDDVKPEFRSVIEDNVKYLRENPSLKARIEGNADERGSREYNVALGQRRAEAVMKAMSLLGVPASRMEAISYGEEKPRRTGHDEASWAENRRGDLIIEAGR
jgi:peptidoglycan-associated lipoprotein